MTLFTSLSGMEVRGKITSTSQGLMVGSMTVMPEPSKVLEGCVVKYIGESGKYTRFQSYLCVADASGFKWEVAEVSQSTLTMTPDRALISDGNGVISASTITTKELGHISGTTLNIQLQLDGKQPKGDYALKKDVPDITGLVSEDELNAGLATKQPVGDYALKSEIPSLSGAVTEEQLNAGLATKQDAGDYALKSDVPSIVGLATEQQLEEGLATKQPVGEYQPAGDYVTTDVFNKAVVVSTTEPGTKQEGTVWFDTSE